ncbi:MAG: membrane protein insertion efficiency factor YidD [Myxococcales bacterium]|nr:membrane protein insertion efficiency factor YidD [Myxococcales bacterium]
MARLLICLVRVYQRTLSHLLGGQCRFHPSCSVYSIGYLNKHGALAGIAGTLWRLFRCAPWGGSGDDPVPEQPWDFPKRRG